MTIPASAIVQVIPGVLGAGGSALDLNGLILTNSTAVPIGTIASFSNPDDVAKYFGPTSTEAALASVYFLGFENSTKKPGNLLFAQYPTSAGVSAYLRGGNVSALTLAELKALTGTLSLSIDGTVKTSSAITLTAATSFSSAATIIQAAFTSLGGTVTYNSQLGAFQFTSATTGATSTISFATGTLSAGLKLTAATGAVTSQGAAVGVPATNLNAIKAITQNWAAFMTTFEPDVAGKLAFSAWTNAQGNRFLYAGWDTDVQATVQNSTTSWAAQLAASSYSGSAPVYSDMRHAAFVLGTIASIDFERLNGRITAAFKSQSGLTPSVGDQTTADTLIANGYNFYGAYATANDQFTFLYPGQVSGQYKWLDGYVNQIWLNNAFQLAMMTLLTSTPSIPYNAEGRALTEQSCMDPINAALNFGAIRAGVTLSAQQRAQVNNAAGRDIDTVLSTRGWYLLIQDATPQVRAARGSFPMTFWYMDGGAVQKLTLASIAVQ